MGENSSDKFIQDQSGAQIYREIINIAFPAFICCFFAIFQELINLKIVGMLGNDKLISAIGLGNTINNILGFGMYVGLNGALNTFVSQAYGANKIELCGVYLWRARIILMIAFLLLSPFFIFSGELLVYLKQDA